MRHQLYDVSDDDSFWSMSTYHCDITKEMDKYNMRCAGQNDWMAELNHTYIMDPEKHEEPGDNRDLYAAPFRVPGATRGYILLEKLSDYMEYKILEFHFYEDTSFASAIGCYNPDIVDAMKQFIGDMIVY